MTLLVIAALWLLAAAVVAVVMSAVGRAGRREDQQRGYDQDARASAAASPSALPLMGGLRAVRPQTLMPGSIVIKLLSAP